MNTPIPEHIDDGITDELRGEIRALVDAKYLVDELARDAVGARLTTAFHDGAYGPHHGDSLFRIVLPFGKIVRLGDKFSAFVPTAQTIGASWRWTTRQVPEDKREQLLAKLQDPVRAAPNGGDRAQYFWIKPLGLFLASEGKNRVGFFRDMKADWIPALVTPCDYPAPDRLAIYRVSHAGRSPCWAVLDDNLLVPVQHPEWALPILRAYGVLEHSSWPAHFPSIDATAQAVNAQATDPLTLRFPPLDLRQMVSKEEFQIEAIPCSALDIALIKTPWQFLWIMALIFSAAMILVGVLPPACQTLRVLAGMIGGSAFGAMTCTLYPGLRAPRRLVDPLAVERKLGPVTGRSAGMTIQD